MVLNSISEFHLVMFEKLQLFMPFLSVVVVVVVVVIIIIFLVDENGGTMLRCPAYARAAWVLS